MGYNPKILNEVLRAKALTRSALYERLNSKIENLEEELERTPEPKQTVLNEIAKELSLPPFIFFMSKLPDVRPALPDFRSTSPHPTPKSRPTTDAIQLAVAIQKVAAESGARGAAELPQFDLNTSSQLPFLARQAREFFEISLSDQQEARDARSFYTLCRRKIEAKGIFVLHASFPAEDGSGFCLTHRNHPLIVVNTTKQSRGRRLFTLIHELAHLLISKEGISDPFLRSNPTETWCNRFAANFLLPKRFVSELLAGVEIPREPDIEDVASIARKLKVSQQAAVLRLEQLRLFNRGSQAKWLASIHNVGNPDFAERGGGAGGPPPQEKVKLAKYGFHFAQIFEHLINHGKITDLALYRASGLKPKYLKSYFAYARSISNDELHSLVLDDE